MIGKKIGRAIVIEEVEPYIAPSGGKHRKFKCQCDCGNTFTALKEHLTSGRVKSCGCLKKECGHPTHRMINTRLYRVWSNMISRCENPNVPAYINYGKRGIKVCDEWKSFEPFMYWAKRSGYTDELTLDRIDNNDGYNMENCRWVSRKVQNNNKRDNHIIEYSKQQHTLSEWADILNIPYKTLHRRIVSLGWNLERAFTQPVRGYLSANTTDN